MYKYILFDMDGTLTDSKPGITECVKYALADFGIGAENDELLGFIGPPLRQSFRDFYGFSAEEAERAITKYRERFSTVGVFENAIYPGVPEMLARLTEAGRTVALASSKPEVFTDMILEQHHIRGYFAEAVGCELDGTRDSKPEVMREALRRLGVTPAELSLCVMVGDRKFDLLGARECGTGFIGVSYGFAAEGEFEALNSGRTAADISELTEMLLNN